MAPTITSQLHVLTPNVEVSFGTITAPTGFDFIDAFVDGSANPEVVVEWRLYELVGGLATRVATAPGGGSSPSVLDWGVGGQGFNAREQNAPRSPAEGAGFTFELRAFYAQPILGGPPAQFGAALIGYDEFDVVANQDSAPVTQQIPANFSEVTFATLNGYAQFADCVISQSFGVPIQFTLYAIAGGITAEVARQTLQSSDGIARLFGSPVRLPGATTYSLRAKFDSNLLQFAPTDPVFVAGGMATHSQNVAAGGAVILTGNDNGPSNANRFLTLPIPATNADVVIPEVGTVPGDGWWSVRVSGLTAPHSVLLPAAPTDGEVVVITDEDGSLATQTFNVNGNGHNVEGVGIFAMNLAYPGPLGSICLEFSAAAVGPGAWHIFADYAPTSGGGALAGNTNGPAGNNTLEAFVESQTAVPAGADTNIDINALAQPQGFHYAGFAGLTAPRTCVLSTTPLGGDQTIVKDEDGSLLTQTIIVDPGAGGSIDNVAGPYTMTGAQNGVKGSVTVLCVDNTPGALKWMLV